MSHMTCSKEHGILELEWNIPDFTLSAKRQQPVVLNNDDYSQGTIERMDIDHDDDKPVFQIRIADGTLVPVRIHQICWTLTPGVDRAFHPAANDLEATSVESKNMASMLIELQRLQSR